MTNDNDLRHPAAEANAVGRVVDRLAFLATLVRGKRVLDLGCLDATAVAKRGTTRWLHERLGETAAFLVGVDNSPLVPENGVDTGFSRILRGDVTTIDPRELGDPEVLVAGELIEHLNDAVGFVAAMRTAFPGATLVLTTPNATGFTNVALAVARRESMHPDHVCVYSYRTLQQMLARAGVDDAEVIPYRVEYTEAKLSARGAKRGLVIVAERLVNLVERVVPMWSNGWIVVCRL